MNIFITGGTGFLGSKLIRNFIEKQHHVFVLARSDRRISKLLTQFEEEKHHHITIIKGDVTQPYLGVDPSVRQSLFNQIDVVYHLAALVKFDEELRDELMLINHIGTKHVLEFSKEIQASKFYYISTAYTVGENEVGYEQFQPVSTTFNNPYEHSKFLAEKEVASYRSVMDISVFRPSIIVGDSKTGKADSAFTLYGFMKGLEIFKRKLLRSNQSLETLYLLGNKSGTSNFVPVDYVSDILTIGLDHAQKDAVYHITNNHPPDNGKILKLIRNRIDFQELDVTDDASLLRETDLILNQMVAVFQHYVARNITFVSDNTTQLLSQVGKKPLTMDDRMLETIINGYQG